MEAEEHAERASSELDRWWKILDVAVDQAESSHEPGPLRETIAQLKGEWSRRPSAELAFVLGYASYICTRWGESDSCLREAELFFRHCLELEPQHARSALYMGYVAFDRGNYAPALDRLVAIALEQLPLASH